MLLKCCQLTKDKRTTGSPADLRLVDENGRRCLCEVTGQKLRPCDVAGDPKVSVISLDKASIEKVAITSQQPKVRVAEIKAKEKGLKTYDKLFGVEPPSRNEASYK
jgi:hypothetical protein